ncbi:MAG: SDR family NAD(P)-dependent oxidoreductase [Myxococcota bacterium]
MEESSAEPQRVVLVTGASSGIGAAAADRLAKEWRVFGTSRSLAGRAERSREIEWLEIDVTEDASVAVGVDTLLDRAGRLDAVVCNAGIGIFGSVEETSLAAARDQFETNVFGVLRVLRATLPHLRAQGAGRVALVGSLAGRVPIPFQAHYSATKAAVDALAGSLANELHGTGVAVSLIEPGDIRTPFNEPVDFEGAIGSPYGEPIARARETIERSLDAAPGPEVVAEVIEAALTAPRPRARYAVGAEVPWVPLLRRLLPDRTVRWAIRRHFKL